MAYTFAQHLADRVAGASPYSEALLTWVTDASDLGAFSTDSLDEYAQIATMDASAPYLAACVGHLQDFAHDCRAIIESRITWTDAPPTLRGVRDF